MRYSIFLILLICSCNNSDSNTLENSPTLSDSSNSVAPPINTATPKEKFTFDELPPLAIYVNEIFKIYNLRQDDTIAAFVLEENEVVYTPEQEFDEEPELGYFKPNSAAIQSGWWGTAGGENWTENYFLVTAFSEIP